MLELVLTRITKISQCIALITSLMQSDKFTEQLRGHVVQEEKTGVEIQVH